LRACDPLLPRLSAEYGVGLGAAAQTVTSFAIAYSVLQLAYGPIGDRYGKYRVITIATFASALTSLACALAPTFAALVVARMFAGATAGALIPLSIAWIGDVVPYERRQPVLARFLSARCSALHSASCSAAWVPTISARSRCSSRSPYGSPRPHC
jgi:MFS family permease